MVVPHLAPVARTTAQPTPGRYDIDTGVAELSPDTIAGGWLLTINGAHSSHIHPDDPTALVRLSGKQVGTVTEVEFAGAQVDVVLEVVDEVRPLLTTESVVAISTLGLLGEPMLSITTRPGGTPLADGAYVKASPSEGAIADLAGQAGASLESVQQLIADVRAGRPLDTRRICRTLSDCTTAPRNGLVSGCYPYDPFYKGLPERRLLAAAKRSVRPPRRRRSRS